MLAKALKNVRRWGGRLAITFWRRRSPDVYRGDSYREKDDVLRRAEAGASRQQGEFVAALAHVLRNPVTVLCLTSEQLVASAVGGETDRSNAYRQLMNESHRLRRCALNLQEFGHILKSTAVYKFTYLDPAEIAESVGREFAATVARQGYELIVTTSGDTPLARADSDALECVIWNLLENAVQYSPCNKTVHLEVGREQDAVCIRVRDRGIGISHAELPRVFESYVRGDSAHQYATGLGIGLSIVRYIVSAHQGLIRADSKVDEGSTFTILLPGVG